MAMPVWLMILFLLILVRLWWFRARHQRSSFIGEESLGLRTVDLPTSTIKLDDDDTDLRLCFRIISPSKTYTLLAETEADWIEWVNKIQGFIASLLNSQMRQLNSGGNDYDEKSMTEKILGKLKLENFQLGKTKVFLRAGQIGILDSQRAEVLDVVEAGASLFLAAADIERRLLGWAH